MLVLIRMSVLMRMRMRIFDLTHHVHAQDAKMGRAYAKDEPWDGVPARDASASSYFEKNNISYYPPRTAKEQKLFGFAMWEMGRLYSFHENEVIVQPHVQPHLHAHAHAHVHVCVHVYVGDRAADTRGQQYLPFGPKCLGYDQPEAVSESRVVLRRVFDCPLLRHHPKPRRPGRG